MHPATSTPLRSWLLRGLVAAVCGVIVVVMLRESWVRMQVDTGAEASAVGRDGCITGATFSTPDGAQHTVDVRTYKANCLTDLDVGDPVTVWYDSTDPGTHAADRHWWLYLGLSLPPLALLGWLLYRSARPATPQRRHPAATQQPPWWSVGDRSTEERHGLAEPELDVGQRAAVRGVFRLAGYEGPLFTAPVTSEDERAFLMEPEDLAALRDPRVVEQALQQLLGRKVFVVERSDAWGEPIPFA